MSMGTVLECRLNEQRSMLLLGKISISYTGKLEPACPTSMKSIFNELAEWPGAGREVCSGLGFSQFLWYIRVLLSSLKLTQSLSPILLFRSTITLALSNGRMFKMENSSFSRLGLLKKLPWSVPPPEAILVPVLRATDEGCAGVGGPCCCQRLC